VASRRRDALDLESRFEFRSSGAAEQRRAGSAGLGSRVSTGSRRD
jgi:hypothetical protein